MALSYYFDIATRYDGKLALAIADDKPPFKEKGMAYLFDLETKSQVRKFPVRYSQPGWRLALSRNDQFCFAGCYMAYGLAAYSSTNGEEVWRRKDLKAVQTVTASEMEDWVFCGREGAAHVLDAATGETMEKFSGVEALYPSPFDQSVILARRCFELHAPLGHKLASIKRTSEFGMPCAFSPSEFVLTEVGRVRCFDLKTQELLWTVPIPDKPPIRSICYCEAEASFIAKLAYRAEPLLYFAPRTGILRRGAAFEAGGVFGCCKRGTAVLTTSLHLVSTQNGALLADLTTPEMIGADPRYIPEAFYALAASNRSPTELEKHMLLEGFDKKDVMRVLILKAEYDRQQKKT